MAVKNWRKQEVGTIGNTHNIIWWQKKGTSHDDRLELWRAETIEFTPVRKEFSVWGVSHRTIVTKNFKTKNEAMKFAKSFMSKN